MKTSGNVRTRFCAWKSLIVNLPFEIASFLLLIAAVGAVVLARRRGGIGADEADRVAVMDFRLPPDIGTMAEAVGGRSTREPLELGSGGGETTRTSNPEGGW